MSLIKAFLLPSKKPSQTKLLIGETEVIWRKNPRQRTIRLRYVGNRFIVSSAVKISEAFVSRFLHQQEGWMKRVLTKSALKQGGLISRATRSDYLQRKREALHLAERELAPLKAQMQAVVSSITIRNNKRVWGSCDRHGVLRFHYQILDLDPEVRRYLLIHELAHLKHRSHAPVFWKWVEQFCPEYKVLRKKLRDLS